MLRSDLLEPPGGDNTPTAWQPRARQRVKCTWERNKRSENLRESTLIRLTYSEPLSDPKGAWKWGFDLVFAAERIPTQRGRLKDEKTICAAVKPEPPRRPAQEKARNQKNIWPTSSVG